MTKIAFLFPGQGSQFVGMGKDLYNNYESAKKVFDTADLVLGRSISKLCFEGPEENLRQTISTQPAIVTTSIAALEAFKESGIKADYTAGHSLGEYCAMYASGVMDLETTLKAIQKRAELMSLVKGGCMAAVINATEEQLKAGLEEGRKNGYVDIANYNSPYQVVITGDSDAVKAAGDYMLANGVKKVVPLAVSGAFHSKYTKDAGGKFEEFVEKLPLCDAQIPVITNVDADITTKAEDFRIKMPKQIYSSVQWTQTVQKMVSKGVQMFIEIGPGRVLAGLVKKTVPEAVVYNIHDKVSLENVIKTIKDSFVEI